MFMAYERWMRWLTIMGLSSHWSTFLQIYSGSVRSTGLTGPNGDSRILGPSEEDEEEESLLLNMRTATNRPCDTDDDDDNADHDGDVRLWFAVLEHLRSGPWNSRRALDITLNRSIIVVAVCCYSSLLSVIRWDFVACRGQSTRTRTVSTVCYNRYMNANGKESTGNMTLCYFTTR